MFVYFLQRKLFLDNSDGRYLQSKLEAMQKRGSNLYYKEFLRVLFFEGFAKPEAKRDPASKELLGKIMYLNGGLFLLHPVEERWPDIDVPDKAFANLYALFERYSWNLNDTPGGEDNEINPDVLGYIFEKDINQKAFGAYYTRPEITEYLCERTIHQLILDKVNTPGVPGIIPRRHFDTVGDLLLALDAALCRSLIHGVLPKLRLLDPACGSAAFLVAAMKTLINTYSAVIGKIEFLNDRNLKQWLDETKINHPSINYFIKKTIITENLFGVDIMEEAVEIAKLRLFLALVAAANTVDDLEPLPNIEFNIMAGNSLMGLIHVDPSKFDALNAVGGGSGQGRIKYRYTAGDGELPGFAAESTVGKTRKQIEREYLSQQSAKKFARVLEEKNRLVNTYRHATSYVEDLRALRDRIADQKREASKVLSKILLDEFSHLDIKFERATWDEKKNKAGKPAKRPVSMADIEALKPFHWGFEFDEILDKNGGFDAIITNPPWEVFEPSAKEFFQEYSDLITKNKMSLEAFRKEQAGLLKRPLIREAFLEYLSRYPHVSRYFKSAPQYANQISIIEEKTAASKTNLYRLFVEQSFRLLRKDGLCGIVIPDGIYNGRSSTQLRCMLFNETSITGLFCIENRKQVFENVDSRFKIVVLTFKKGPTTTKFPATFMRTEVSDLEHFPAEGAIMISADLVQEMSPDMFGIIEFKEDKDINIVRKFLEYPRLNETLQGLWGIHLSQELNMTADHSLFRNEPKQGRLPLVQGGMIHQFDAAYSEPKFWIDEAAGRKAVLGHAEDIGQVLPYQTFRFSHRRIARSTDERAAIACVLPPGRFCADTAQTTREYIPAGPLLFLTGVFNSFVVDWELRLRITTHVDMHFVYAMRIPRLTESNPAFSPIVSRVARIICTTPEFDDLAKEIGMESHKEGVIYPAERGAAAHRTRRPHRPSLRPDRG